MHFAGSPELLKPASQKFIFFTLISGLTLNLLPWHGLALMFRPDFLAVVLLFWAIREPRKLGFTITWIAGLLMDVSDGVFLGQHALAYTLVVFVAIILHRRIQRFGLWQQASHVILLLLLLQLTMLFIRLFGGATFPGPGYFLPCLTGTMLWPVLSLLFLLPQRAKAESDPVYSSGNKNL